MPGPGHAHRFTDQAPRSNFFHSGFSEEFKASKVRLVVWQMSFPLAPNDPLLTSFTLNCTAGHSDPYKPARIKGTFSTAVRSLKEAWDLQTRLNNLDPRNSITAKRCHLLLPVPLKTCPSRGLAPPISTAFWGWPSFQGGEKLLLMPPILSLEIMEIIMLE